MAERKTGSNMGGKRGHKLREGEMAERKTGSNMGGKRGHKLRE
jgi:hypothetical protein